jgi:hypothetical protein
MPRTKFTVEIHLRRVLINAALTGHMDLANLGVIWRFAASGAHFRFTGTNIFEIQSGGCASRRDLIDAYAGVP